MTAKKIKDALPKGATLLWYEILDVLGKGGFGITYLARDTNLDQLVAIKEYLPVGFAVRDQSHSVRPNSPNDTKTFDWGLERFLQEAQTLAKFKHRAIVRVVSFFRNANTAYMVMEYEEGDSLEAVLRRKGQMTEQDVMVFLPPLLEGLEELHRNQFIHRDIKPANILIRKDGSPVILDFGSARQALGNAGDQMTSLLSMGYSPFEQYDSSGNRQGPWSDIYAMGGVLYRCISGGKPPDAALRINARLRNSPDPMKPALEVGRGRFSDRFLIAVDKALESIETDRPQSVAAWRPLLLGAPERTVAAPAASAAPAPAGMDSGAARAAVQEAAAMTRAGGRKEDTSGGTRKHKVQKNSWRSFIASMNEFGSATRRDGTRLKPSSPPATRT
ncbi:MAG: serine/threonine protein kinase, partial [Magnetococcales bacterium]|nr:serine/threonine protein kinase [Magnetococcales bacterium]